MQYIYMRWKYRVKKYRYLTPLDDTGFVAPWLRFGVRMIVWGCWPDLVGHVHSSGRALRVRGGYHIEID